MLRIVYLRYKEAVLKLHTALGKTLDQFDKFFKISDADFTIIINPNLPDFEKINAEINILSYYLLCKIGDKLENDIREKTNYYLSSFSNPKEDRNKQLDNLVDKINNTHLMTAKRNREISYYANSFEGDKLDLLIFDDIKNNNNINLDDIKIYNARNELNVINTNNSSRFNGIMRKKIVDGKQKNIFFPDKGDNEENAPDLYDKGVTYTNQQGKKDLIANKNYLYQPLIRLREFLELIKMLAFADMDTYISQFLNLRIQSELQKTLDFEHLGGASQYIINKKNYLKIRNMVN